MPECAYCAASFDDESEYLAHLRSEHEGELSRIDRRRVEQASGGGDRSRLVLYGIGAIVVLLLATAVYVTVLGGGGGGAAPGSDGADSGGDASGVESEPLPNRGDPALLQDVERFPSEGRDHAPTGSELSFGTDPPTSGTHYDPWTRAGYYTETQPAGELVHSLEHGYVVIYYDPAALSDDAEASLRAFAANQDQRFRSVVVVPNPDPQSPYVLTAWRTRLRMQEYDAEVVRAFLAEYLGRGPENPVR